MAGWKTITAIALGLLVALGNIFGVAPAESLPDWANALLAVVAAVWGWYGRFVAKTDAAPQLRKLLGGGSP